MRDTVYIRGLRVQALIGVHEEERREKQTLRLDIDVACDATVAARDDDVERAVDYHAIVKAVEAHVAASTYRLVETLAEHLAEMILRMFDAPWVRVRVGKPDILAQTEEVGIVVERGRRGTDS